MKKESNIGLGIALGLVFGLVFHNIGLGLAFGILFGVMVPAKKKNGPGDGGEDKGGGPNN